MKDVAIIKTSDGELTYPFDKEYPRILGFMPKLEIGEISFLMGILVLIVLIAEERQVF